MKNYNYKHFRELDFLFWMIPIWQMTFVVIKEKKKKKSEHESFKKD